MRTTVFIVLVLMAVLLTVGCSRQRTYVAPGGKVTVNEKAGEAKSVEVVTDKGKATIDVEKKSISEKELGAPVYPGCKVEVSGNYQSSETGQAGSAQHVMLTTTDSFDKVLAFYKSKLKNVSNTMINQGEGDSQMAILSAAPDDGSQLNVNITTDKDAKLTRIQVIRVAKKS